MAGSGKSARRGHHSCEWTDRRTDLLVDEAELAAREPHIPDLSAHAWEQDVNYSAPCVKNCPVRTGRNLYHFLRRQICNQARETLMKNWKTSAESILTTGPVVRLSW